MSKASSAASYSARDDSRLSASNLLNLYNEFMKSYQAKTPKRLQIIDAFCVLCFILTLIPIAYGVLVGTFPMNALLSGIFAPLGTLIFTICLRFQIDKESKYAKITEEKAFWEYLFCMVCFYIAVINFLG